MTVKRLLFQLCIIVAVYHSAWSAPLSTEKRSIEKRSIACDACEGLVDLVRKLSELHVSEDVIVKAAIEFCEKFSHEDDHICSMIVPEFKTEVLYVFNHVALSSREICGTIFSSSCGGGTYDPFKQNWTVNIPGNKPPHTPYKLPSESAPTNRILHISDIHWDPIYTPGLIAQCGEPMCCRPPMGKGTPSQPGAGYWGDIHCDIPLVLLVNLMEHLNSTSDQFDWIYLTGDLPSHSDWTQNKTTQLKALDEVIGLFDKYLPNKPLFFSFGNHESAPVNSFPPTYLVDKQDSIQWLYDEATARLKKWIDTPDALATFEKGGFYSYDYQGFRIISLQTNYCNNRNWWLLINNTDPDGMLKWFVNQLSDAEQKGMKVHVLGHIPPNGDCINPWGDLYMKIINRFEDTVVGQFFGHVHEDRIVSMIDFDTTPPRPFGTLYLGPSVTTYTFQFPGYTIYTVDGTYKGSSRYVLDHDTYYLNITDANLTNKPKWELEYSVKKDYKMTNLSNESWLDLLLNTFTTDHETFMKYYHHLVKSANMQSECTGKCIHNTICAAITGLRTVPNKCNIIPSNTATPEDMALYFAAHDHC